MRPRVTTGPDIAILASQLRDLKDKFDYPDLFGRGGSASITVTGGGGAPTVVVAASDSSDFSKGRADFICTGTDDQVTIQTAVEALPAVGGRVLLTEGSFAVGANDVIVPGQAVTLEGFGQATKLTTTDTTGAIIQLAQGGRLKNVYLVGTGGLGPTGVAGTGGAVGDITVEGVIFQSLAVGAHITGDRWRITGCRTYGSAVTRAILASNGNTGVLIANNNFEPGGIIDMDEAHRWVIAGNILNGSVIFNRTSGSSAGEILTIAANTWFGADDIFNEAVIEGTAGPTTINIVGNTIPAGQNTGIKLVSATKGTIAANHIQTPFHGIHLDTCSGLNIVGNTIDLADEHGIYLDDTSTCHISDNLIINPGQETDNTFDGIFLETNSDQNYLTGNRVIAPVAGNQPRYGINVSAATCNNNIYVGNWAGPTANFGTGPYNDAGTGTLNTWPGAAAPVGDNFTL